MPLAGHLRVPAPSASRGAVPLDQAASPDSHLSITVILNCLHRADQAGCLTNQVGAPESLDGRKQLH